MQQQPLVTDDICSYFTRKVTRFFGVDSSNEEQARTTWVERRRRLAIKKLGGVKVITLSQLSVAPAPDIH